MRSLVFAALLALLAHSSFSHAASALPQITSIGHSHFDGHPSLSVVFAQSVENPPNKWADVFPVSLPEGSPIGRWQLDDAGTLLSYQPVTPGAEYYITPAATLNVQDLHLDQRGRMRVDVPQIKPLARFLGQGPLVPLRGQDTLPVETQHISGFDVEFLQITDVPAFLQANHGRALSAWDIDNHRQHYQSVEQLRYQVRKSPEKKQQWRVPLKHLKQAGWYLLILRPEGSYDFQQYQVRHVIRTNLGLQARRYPKHTALFASRLSDGRTIANGKVHIFGQRGQRYSGQLDEQGFLQLDFRLDREDVIILEHGNDTAVLPMSEVALDLSQFDIDGREQQNINAFMWSNRQLLQPGESLPLHILLRDADGRPLPEQDISLRILRPDGKEFLHQRLGPESPGYFHRRLDFDAALPHGHWRAQVRTDPSSQRPISTFDFRIEAFVPERMQLHLSLAHPQRNAQQDNQLDIQGQFLYGSPAADAPVQVKSSLSPLSTPFSGRFKRYHIGYAQDLPSDPVYERALTLDAEGKQQIALPPLLSQRLNTPVRVRTQVELYQQARLEVARSQSYTLWPHAQMPGIEPQFSELDGSEPQADFNLALFNTLGQWLPGGELQITLLKVQDDQNWRYDPARGWTRTQKPSLAPQHSQTLRLSDAGPTPLSLPIDWGDWVLRAVEHDSGARSEYAFSVGWSMGADPRPLRPQQLDLKLTQRQWQAGDTLSAEVQLPFRGQLTLALETDQVLQQQRLHLDEGQHTLSVTLPESLARHDIYLSAMLLGSTQKGVPKRAIGIVPVPLARADRALQVSLEHADKAEPKRSSRVKIKVQGARHDNTRVVLSAVDRGIINLSRYRAPSAFHYFFSQKRYSGDLHDLYGRLFSPIDAPYAQRRYGAGAASEDLRAQSRTQHKSYVYMSEAIALDAAGEAEIELDLPDYNGSAQLVATAFNADQFGHTVSDLAIAAPLVAELTLPRFAVPGDQSSLGVSLHNTLEHSTEVQLSLEHDGTLHWLSDLPFTTPISLAAGERRDWRVDFEALPKALSSRLGLKLDSAVFKAERDWQLAIVPLQRRELRQRFVPVPAGQQIAPPTGLTQGLVGPELRQHLRLSPIAPLPVDASLAALYQYPYGCAEQLTSKARPWLMPELQRFAPESKTASPSANEALHLAIQRLQNLQTYRGGFALWQGGRENPWVSVYVSDFLFRAQSHSKVPEAMLNSSRRRLKAYVADQFPHRRDGERELARQRQHFAARAYALWVLAQQGQVDLSQVQSLAQADRHPDAGPLPWVHLSQAQLLLGDSDGARASLERARQSPRPEAWFGDYGSRVRDSASAIGVLHQSRERGLVGAGLDAAIQHWTERLLDALSGRQYLSTQEHMALLSAAHALGFGREVQWQAELDGQTLSPDPVRAWRFSADSQLKNTGDTELWAQWQVSGYPERPMGPEQSTQPLEVFERQYYTEDGQPYRGQALHSGDTLYARISLQSAKALPDALLIEAIPAGFRLLNPSLDLPPAWPKPLLSPDSGQPWWPHRVDQSTYHDDRLVLALPVPSARRLHISYALKAGAPGRYQVPPSFLERMYDPEQRAYGQQAWHEIQVLAR